MVLIFTVLCSICFSAEHKFTGKHLIASYYDCNEESLANIKQLVTIMEESCLASGAHVLQQMNYEFPGGGLTHLLLLSESHASIHTYPEYKACFVDLFTCGDSCDSIAFDKVLTEYLKPGKKSIEVIHRN
ncbi:MAG: adenosylmethionine decarboxylase [Chlamydiales bacterium]|nr:adenosylmethionine decarboxylase [Chlamydiales bacterium]